MSHISFSKIAVALGTFIMAAAISTAIAQSTSKPKALEFDAVLKEYDAAEGETDAPFTFSLKNISSDVVSINRVRTSCGCTVAKVPAEPWILQPDEGGSFEVAVNLAGKSGRITKSVFVETEARTYPLTVRVNIPGGSQPAGRPAMTDRQRNQLIALRQPQAIFLNDCAACHATPGEGKHGKELYQAVCAICHDSHNRAAMVPDLKNLNHPTSRTHWEKWITEGRKGTMMPAFHKDKHGPLDQEQIDSLVDYLTETITMVETIKDEPLVPDPFDILLPETPALPRK